MEMNMFIPQSVQTQLELANIADVKRQIITPRYSRPIIKFKQDTVLGTYKMTDKTKKIDYRDAMNLSMYCNISDMFVVQKENYDTHKLYSLIIPSMINYSDGKVNINNGKLLTGVMGDSILNQKIVYYSWDRHGPDTTKNFFDNAQKLVTNWLLINGFSVGLGDATTDQEVIDDIKTFCEVKQMEVDKLITEMENNPETLDPDTFETNILSTLKASDGEITKKVYEHLKKNNPENNFYVMIESKAKGSQGNIGQIIGGLGQNVLEFRRIKKKVNNRTLPHFFQNDDRAFARGFIPNSYYHGLTPKEFFFHHMTAREGMIDTAIKSVTGDTQIIILENGITKNIKIGDWIDNILDVDNNSIQLDTSNDEYRELIELKHEVYIPTTDLDGNVSWGLIKNITRHNPGKILYQIKTNSGRDVIVTDSHSLLIWNPESKQLERKSASNVNIGDFVPITKYIDNISNQEIKDYDLDNLIFESIEERNQAILDFNYQAIFVNIDPENPLRLIIAKDINTSFGTIISEYPLKVSLESNTNVHNNIVLDSIIEINEVDVKLYPKVYDLTVPSTLNFGIANGLHVVDTADSGYLQRKLVKGMEDIIMAYDKTVRSGNNVIIQTIYGENNINQTHYKEVDIKLVNMSNTEIKNNFGFTKSEISNISKEFKFTENDLNKFNNDYIKTMMDARDDLRKIQMKSKMSYITMLDKYQLPVNMTRIIEDAKNAVFSSKDEMINPYYIIHAINYILKPDITKVNLLGKDKDEYPIKLGDQNRAKSLFKIALLEYLSPRKCIYEYKLSKQQFDIMIIEIIKSFRKACVEPGEMVGVLTAQSLGECLTQMSVSRRSMIHLKMVNKENNEFYILKTKIGKFIDKLYKKHPENINDIPGHIDSTEFNLDNLDHEYYICGVTQDEKVKWNKISHLSRHPTNGNLLEIKTSSGRSVTSTKSHNFLKRTANDGIVAVTSENLKLKDRIPIARKIEFQGYTDILTFDDYELKLTQKMGWLFGAYLAEGNLNKNRIQISNISPEYYNNIYDLKTELNINISQHNFQGAYGPSTSTLFTHKELANIIRTHFKCGSFNKVIPEFVHNSNLDFISGLLRGYFDGDGNISVDRHIIRVGSRSEKLIQDVSMLLLYFGIFSSMYKEKKSNSDSILYCLGIPHKYARQFLESIGSDIEEKKKGIEQIIKFSESEHKCYSEVIDKIPELGHIIARIGTNLKMPGNSRNYGVWGRKNISIGRRTLEVYIKRFEERYSELKLDNIQIKSDIEYLKMISEGEVIWDEITEINEIEDPKEYVYDFTVPNNETFMVNDGLIVHNTLNSVTWLEQICYTDNNNCKITQIGEMIDKLLEDNIDNVQNVDNITETEYLDISHLGYKIQSVDENGKMHWKLIEAITRHLPGHNGNVVKVKTLSGREVVATKAKSFLIRRDNKLIDIEGAEIKIGDRLPIQKNVPEIDNYIEYDNLDINEPEKLLISSNENIKLFLESYLENFNINNSIYINNINISQQEFLILSELCSRLNIIFTNNLIQDFEILEDVFMDPIIEITELPLSEITPNHNKVYDLTVADTRNFNIFGGLCMRDTFHSAGVGVKGMQGIPRFREILSYSKKIQTPYMIIRLIPEVRSEINIAHKIEAYLKHTIFGDLIDKMDIIYDPYANNIPINDNINVKSIYYINNNSVGLENLPWLFKFTISREAMLENDITLLDIKTKFMKYWDEYSNDSSANKKKIVLSKITNGCIISNFDNSENPIIHVRFDIPYPDNYSLVEIGQYILTKITIKGVATIEKVDRVDKQKVIEYDEDQAIKTNSNEWVMYTTGIDLDKIKGIKYIDFESVYINDIYLAYLNFGIEAARSLIINEADRLYNGSGNPLNITHVALLADIMTNTGNITSIDRHGINRLDTDPLSRASFEKTVEQLIMASAFNEIDHMRSVSSRIMAGRCIKGGTGLCEITLDSEQIENSEYNNQMNLISSNNNKTIEANNAITAIMESINESPDIFMP